MVFRDWVKGTGLRQADVATLLGIELTTLRWYLKTDGLPSVRVAARIEHITKGAVRLRDWCPDEYGGTDAASD